MEQGSLALGIGFHRGSIGIHIPEQADSVGKKYGEILAYLFEGISAYMDRAYGRERIQILLPSL